MTASRPSGRSGSSIAAWLTVPVVTLSPNARRVATSAGERRKCSTHTPWRPTRRAPGCERVHAVVGDDDQPRPEAELGGQLACTGPEADHLGPLPRRVVAKALAESSGGAACEGWVGVRLDLELERRAGRREFEQLVEQQRALVAWSAVSVAEPARADLRGGALVGPAGQRRADFEQRVVQQHELAVGGQAAVRLEAVERPLECAGERRGRRVRAVGAAEAVGVKRREHCHNCRDERALGRLRVCNRRGEKAVETAVRERSRRSAGR